jgi:hypothetical protein
LLLQKKNNKTKRFVRLKDAQKEANWKRKAGTVRGGSDMNNIVNNSGTFNRGLTNALTGSNYNTNSGIAHAGLIPVV